MKFKSLLLAFLPPILVCVFAQVSDASTYDWQPTTSGVWNSTNWGGTLPGGADTGIIDDSGTAEVSVGVTGTASKLEVGVSANGSLNVDGGIVGDTTGYLGFSAGSVGSATVSSGTWNNVNQLFVGDAGAGTLNVTGGNVTSDVYKIGSAAGADGIVAVSSGSLNYTSLYVGYSGTGTLTLTGAGIVAGAAAIDLGFSATAVGTLNVGNGGSAGTLSVPSVNGASGTAVVNFNQNGIYTFTPQLTGGLAVNVLGGGTTNISANNSFTGATTVTSSTLLVSGSLSSTGSTTVSGGGKMEVDGAVNPSATNTITDSSTLDGDGSVGPITAHGGNLDPGLTTADNGVSTGELTVAGAVTLSSTTNFGIRLGLAASGTDSDQLNVISGFVTLNDANLQLSLDTAHMNPPTGGTPTFYDIINGGGGETGTGTDVFATYDGTAITNNTFTVPGGWKFKVLYEVNANGSGQGTGNDVVLEMTAIPEPQTWGLLLGGIAFLAVIRSRR